MKRACNLDLELLLKEDLFLLNEGALVEQFVAQELLASARIDELDGLFSWVREQVGSSAEIDFLLAQGAKLIPIEVKSGAIGSLRSLKIFLAEKKLPFGVRISEQPLSFREKILSVPFYLIEQMPRLLSRL